MHLLHPAARAPLGTPRAVALRPRTPVALVGLLLLVLASLVLAGCSDQATSTGGTGTACERAVRAAAEVPDKEEMAGDFDGAIAVCESVEELEAAVRKWPAALDGADLTGFVGDRCRAYAVIRPSAICSTIAGATASPDESTPTPSPTATPNPIVFGTNLDGTTVTGTTSRFKTTYPRTAFVADLPPDNGGKELTITVTPAAGGAVAFTRDVTLPEAGVPLYGAVFDLPKLLKRQAGEYIMRYTLGGNVVAEGRFELVG